jgi:small subunit ribosomal protein S6
MARLYETMFILSAALEEADVEKELAKIADLVGREGGTVKEWNKLGRRRLAFEIKRQSDGFYALLNFEAEPASIEKLGQVYRLDESILRHMTIAKDE